MDRIAVKPKSTDKYVGRPYYNNNNDTFISTSNNRNCRCFRARPNATQDSSLQQKNTTNQIRHTDLKYLTTNVGPNVYNL